MEEISLRLQTVIVGCVNEDFGVTRFSDNKRAEQPLDFL